MEYALVTGASRGIGRAAALRLAQDGLPVVVNYLHSEDAAQETADLIRAAGGTAELWRADMRDADDIERAVAEWETNHPDDYVSVLVNNAGIRRDNLLIFMQDDAWREVLETTLNGFFFLTRRLLKNMLTHRKGRIINVSSLSGVKGMAGQANYAAAKAALIGATKALALEVAPRKVTVNAVAPGFIATDMTRDLDEAELKKLIPAGRFGSPKEVASLISFLASEEAAYITGQVIHINGGLYT